MSDEDPTPVEQQTVWASVSDVQALLKRARGHKKEVIRRRDLSLIPSFYAVGFYINVLFQIGLRRCIELAEAVIEAHEARRFATLFVLGRAGLETAALVADTQLRVTALLENQTSRALADLRLHVDRALWGAKDERWRLEADNVAGVAPVAINVLTTLERIDRTYKETLVSYHVLSEFAHPNWPGMIAAYTPLDGNTEEVTFTEPFLATESDHTISTALSGSIYSLYLVSTSIEQLEEQMPELIRLSEEDLYRTGEWPANVPYRWS